MPLSAKHLRAWWTVARQNAGPLSAIPMLRALASGPVPREVWQQRMRTCLRCPILDRQTMACRKVIASGRVLGCRCYTPLLALTAAPYADGCYAHNIAPHEGWPNYVFAGWRARVRAVWGFIFPTKSQ